MQDKSPSLITAFVSLLGLSSVQQPFLQTNSTGGELWSTRHVPWDQLNATLAGKLHQSSISSGPCKRTSQVAIPPFQDENKPTVWEKCQRVAAVSDRGYYIQATKLLDVTKAFHFAKQYNIPVTIDNFESDFCHSPVPSLAIWTEGMKWAKFENKFRPQGCDAEQGIQVISFEPGVTPQKLHELADFNGKSIVLGESKTHDDEFSILTPKYGLVSDNVVEYHVVLPSGEIQVVNKCQNTDLWFALRGGDASSFGLVVQTTVKVLPQITLQTYSASFGGKNEVAKKVLDVAAANAIAWAKLGWGGKITQDGFTLAIPGATLEEVEQSLKPLVDAVATLGLKGEWSSVSPAEYPELAAKFARPLKAESKGLASRLIPDSVFSTPEGRYDIVLSVTRSISLGVKHWKVILSTPYGFEPEDASPSAFHPAFRTSPWYVLLESPVGLDETLDQRRVTYSSLGKANNFLKYLTPDSGTFYAHGDLSEIDHTEAFWGENASSLRKVKLETDPENRLKSWNSISFTGQGSDARFTCYTPARRAFVPCYRWCR